MRPKKYNPVGRPTLYNKETISSTKEYIANCNDKPYKVGGKIMWTVNIPTIEGLALKLKVTKETIYDWESKYQEFSDLLSELRSVQADRLLNKGLSGDYNHTIAKLMLIKHGYRDGIDVNNFNKEVVDTEEKEKTDKALDEYIGSIGTKKKK